MRTDQIAAQLYTIRDFIKTPAEIAESMKKISAIGYKSVQVSGMGPIEESELVKILDDNGLRCIATHEPGDEILNNPEKIVDRLNKLNCSHTAYPYPDQSFFESIDGVKKLAEKLNNAGKILSEAGKTLSYHNHQMEFRQLEGRTILEILFEETDPKYLQGEIDTYWVQFGGSNPAAWCEKLKDRLPALHLKDYAINIENKPVFAEVGYGNLNWENIITEARLSGCEWFIVEQDICERNPFESLKMSFDWLQEHFVG